MPIRLAILTISDAGSRGERADASGDQIAMWAKERGYPVAERALVPDETGRIAALVELEHRSAPDMGPDGLLDLADALAGDRSIHALTASLLDVHGTVT